MYHTASVVFLIHAKPGAASELDRFVRRWCVGVTAPATITGNLKVLNPICPRSWRQLFSAQLDQHRVSVKRKHCIFAPRWIYSQSLFQPKNQNTDFLCQVVHAWNAAEVPAWWNLVQTGAEIKMSVFAALHALPTRTRGNIATLLMQMTHDSLRQPRQIPDNTYHDKIRQHILRKSAHATAKTR